MSNGELFDQGRTAGDAVHSSWTMLDAIEATSDGVWIDFRGFTQGTLNVTGITTATLQVRGSNAETIPSNSDDATQVGSNITADGFTRIIGPYRWLKVKCSAWSAGTVTANLYAVMGGGGGEDGGAASTVTANQGGTWTVQPGNTANTTAWLVTGTGGTFPVTGPLTDAQLRASAVEVTVADNGMACTRTISSTGVANDATNISTNAATLFGVTATNTNASARYIKIYDVASPTSTNTPMMTYLIPGSGGISPNFPSDGVAFATRISLRFTTGVADTDTGQVASNEIISHMFFRD